jgi:hypothetical protein
MIEAIVKSGTVTVNALQCMIRASCEYRQRIIKAHSYLERLQIRNAANVYTPEQHQKIKESYRKARHQVVRFILLVSGDMQSATDGKMWDKPGLPSAADYDPDEYVHCQVLPLPTPVLWNIFTTLIIILVVWK